jgi:hypothetical protein
MMPYSKVKGEGIERVKPRKARGGEVLFVDGNRDGFGTDFQHEMHIKRLGEKASCVKCHHMNMPGDRQSGCWECHDDMYAEADTFKHDWHASPEGANIRCDDCHRVDEERTKQTAKKCADCHADLFADAKGNKTEIDSHLALSYVDALHKQCIDCHRTWAEVSPAKKRLTLCPTCHFGMRSDYLKESARDLLPTGEAKPVIMPPAPGE